MVVEANKLIGVKGLEAFTPYLIPMLERKWHCPDRRLLKE
jgi:hypothetical protein